MANTLVDFLAASAQQFGPRPALYFKPGLRYRCWTYAQVWEASGKVASMLQQQGLAKGDRVLLWAHNCPQWVIAFFGCMRAGAIAVPLDLRSTPDFVSRVTSKTQPKLAFVSRLTLETALETPKVSLEDLEE